MYTTILGAESEKKTALSLSRGLKKSGHVAVDNLHNVMQKNAKAEPAYAAKSIVDYVRKESTTSIIVICSATLCSLFDTVGDIPLQINASDVTINSESFKRSIDVELRKKITLVGFSLASATIPECFQGCETMQLVETNPEVEISNLNITRLESALRRRNNELGIQNS